MIVVPAGMTEWCSVGRLEMCHRVERSPASPPVAGAPQAGREHLVSGASTEPIRRVDESPWGENLATRPLPGLFHSALPRRPTSRTSSPSERAVAAASCPNCSSRCPQRLVRQLDVNVHPIRMPQRPAADHLAYGGMVTAVEHIEFFRASFLATDRMLPPAAYFTVLRTALLEEASLRTAVTTSLVEWSPAASGQRLGRRPARRSGGSATTPSAVMWWGTRVF